VAIAIRHALKETANRLGLPRNAREVLAVGALLSVAFVLRLFLSQVLGLAGDLQSYVKWGASLTHHVSDFYAANPDDNYPPLINIIFALVDRLYMFLMHRLGVANPSLDPFTSRRAAVFMRLPFVLSDIGVTATLYLLGRRVTTTRWALACASLYAFSPGVILDGTLWAQSDGLLAFSLLLATIFAINRKPAWSGIMLGLGVVLKLFPVLYAPLLLVYLYRTGGLRYAARYSAAAVATVLVICLPFILPPHPQVALMLRNMQADFSLLPFVSVSAYNLWWMLGMQQANPAAHLVGPISISIVGWLLFGLVTTITMTRIWRKPSSEVLFLAMGTTAVAFFDLTTGQHERYIYPAIVMFLAAALYRRWHVLLFLVTSIAMFLDVGTTIIWNSAYSRPVVDVSAWNTFLGAHPKIYVAISIVDVFVLIVALLAMQDRVIAEGRTPSALTGVGASLARFLRAGRAGA
jgi:Gpi18-like mannosyltransferase